MAEKGFKRKLAAILCADLEGYSRLMDDDEKAFAEDEHPSPSIPMKLINTNKTTSAQAGLRAICFVKASCYQSLKNILC